MRSFISLKFLKYYILYIFIYSLIFLPIFLNKGVPVGNDWSVPVYSYHLQNWFKNNIYSWADENNFLGEKVASNTALLFQGAGYLLSYFFNMSGALYFKLLLLTSFCIGGISAFNLLNRYGFNKWGSFIGGLIFTLNPVTFDFLLMGWNFVLLSVFLAPLFILILDRYINTKKPAYLSICALIYAISFVESQSMFYYPIIFLVYLLCQLRRLTIKNLLSIFKSLIVLVALAFLLHSFWLLSLIFYKDPVISRTVAEIDIIRFAIRTSFLNMIRGWGSVFNYQFETAYLRGFLIFSFTLPAIFVISLLKKRRFKNSIAIFYCILFFFPLFFYSINKYLSFIPYTNVLRDFNRSFPYLFLSFSFFTAGVIDYLFKKESFTRFALFGILVISFALSIHPFWFGYLYSAKKNEVGISDMEVDQRLRLYQPEEDIKNFDLSITKKALVLNEKALLLPTGGAYIYPNNKKFNGMWASISENNIFYSNVIKGIFLTGNSSETMWFLSSKITEPFESEVKCYLLAQPFLHSFLASNFNYIMVKNKVINTYRDIGSEQVESCLDEYSDLFKPIFNSEDISIYEISDNHFLPHFYISQNLIYSDGDIESLPDIVSFGDWKVRSAIFLARNAENTDGNTDNTDEARRTLMERADEIFMKGELKNRVSEEELKVAIESEELYLPYVRWKPGSLIYSLILKKEQVDEWKARDYPEKLLDKKLFYASKRISEVEKFGTNDEELITEIMNRYQVKIKEAIELLRRKDWRSKGTLEKNVIKTEATIKAHLGKIMDLGLNEEEKRKARDLFEDLQEEIENLKTKRDFSKLVYNFEIPKKGSYKLFIKKENLSPYFESDPFNPFKFILDEKESEIKGRLRSDGWVEFDEIYFNPGEHKLVLLMPQAKNLVEETGWQVIEEVYRTQIEREEQVIRITRKPSAVYESLGISPEAKGYLQEIKEYQPGALYRLTLDCSSNQGLAGLAIEEVFEEKEKEPGVLLKGFFPKTEKGKFERFEIFFESSPRAKKAMVYLFSKENNKDVDVRFKNIWVERIFEPTIILRSTNHQSPITTYQLPRITFIKINPTKYKVKVEGAQEPYTLVFSESFHEGWKAYVNNTPILQYSNTSNEYGEVVASYFDGEIKEGTHKNIFLDGNTFETWGKKSLSEDKHLLVNGYANSWYITPEDSNGKEDYEIIIEFWPQRSFYIGLGISLMTLLGCLGYLGYDFAKKKIGSRK